MFRPYVHACVLLALLCAVFSGAASTALLAQESTAIRPIPQADRVSASADRSVKVPLTGHRPAWANEDREIAGHSVDLSTPWRVSITLQRDPGVQAAFEQLLADQQKPGSPMYHHWLTATQIGQLYGPTQNDVDALANWLTSHGLKIVNVAPSRMLIYADGTIGAVSAAFQTNFAYYKRGTAERRAVRTEPLVPAALAPVIGSIGGMAEILTEPQSHIQKRTDAPLNQNANANGGVSPEDTRGSAYHYLSAGDFDTIYDINSIVTGGNTGATIGSLTNNNCPVPTAQCIAIIGRSRVTPADISAYMSAFGANGETGYNLTQMPVPSAAGGSDPGSTYSNDTSEATLDVQRVVGTANGAQAVLVTSASTSGADGVSIATSYNVNTLMYPIMTISFGLCEASEGTAYESADLALFAQAAAEGISTFVSSGDAGAAGCDTAFTRVPATQVLGINELCASPYVTCVGGTEYNDTTAYSTYWNSSNGSSSESAKSYIPEGAWNESTSSGTVSGTGGGVSTSVVKPSFQTGLGVPLDGYRDTPDVAFSAAGHVAYDFIITQSGTQFASLAYGTSAAAPGMAAIAALLNTSLGYQAGNLNPLIYQLAATNPSAFHDVTVASSGVTNCTTATPSICNNSTPAPSSLTGGLAGYVVTTGYDLATGWGSLDVANFLNAAAAANLTVSSTHLSNFLQGSTGNTYTLTVTNNGATASNGAISVTDTLPSGFTATAMSGSGWTCTLSNVTCTQTTPLSPNTSASPITLTVSVSSSDSGSYVNAVSVSVAGTPGGNGTDSTIVGSLLPPALTMSFSPASIAANGSSTLTYLLSNPNSAASGLTLNGVAFSQVNPINLTFTSNSTSCTSGSSFGTLNAYTNENQVSGVTLAPGGSCILKARATAPAGRYDLGSSTITSTNGVAGAAATATLIAGAELSAASSHSGNFTAGDAADTYTLTVASNSVSGAATSGTVTVTDTLPSGFTATAISGSGWTCTLSSLSCTRSDALAVGASYPAITLTVSVAATDAGVYYNTVTVSGGGGFSPAPGKDATSVLGPPTTTETFSPGTVTPNTNSTLVITLGNVAGNPVTLTGVAFNNNLPPGLTISNPSGAATTCSGASLTAVAQGSSIALAGASLAPGATCTVSVYVFSTANGSYTDATGKITSTDSPAGPGASATLTVFTTPTRLVFTQGPPPTIPAGGNAGLVTVALEDAAGDIATTSTTQLGLQVTGPSGYNYVPGFFTPTNGQVTFDLSGQSLTAPGTYSYRAIAGPGSPPNTTVTDTVLPGPGVPYALSVTGLTTFTAPGMSGTVTVKALDAYGNVVTSFTGTVTLTSTDPQVVFTPASYTYAAADAGSHAFTVTLNTAGSQTVTAASGSLTGSETNILVEDAIWILNTNGTLARITDAGVQTTTAGTASGTSAYGAVAFDNAGDVWTVSNAMNSVQAYSKTGGTLPIPGNSAAGVTAPVSLFIDGIGQVWVANGNNSVSVLTNAGTAVSPSTGYQGGSMNTPSGILVDSAGSVWVTNRAGNSVTKIFGAAAPVVTPTVTGTINNTLGTRP